MSLISQATLPIMALDLMDLVSHATGGAKPPIDKFVSASLLPVMVFLGAVYRFYANELGAREREFISLAQIVIGVASFAGSCALFGIAVWAIVVVAAEDLPGWWCFGARDVATVCVEDLLGR